ncbi:redoxin domain-containing protein [Thalassoroseus pseudoceratinae]|uniref:redoxin domain-containing protein n=1 Tax=Thalassoroseus pseudoceratinae TaxID=2713176 RepID=UPI001421DA74|nr:redoxin domain-containing protein [Thalassoroseus pseudoceratinae]
MRGAKRFRFLVLPISAAIIIALCVWKVSQPPAQNPASDQSTITLRQAPDFAVYDARKPQRLVRLSSYLGRHRILLVFFDGQKPFDSDPVIRKLTKSADALESRGIKLFALSSALPQTNRGRMKTINPDQPRWVFPILSDPTFATQRAYRRIDEDSSKPKTQTMQSLRELPGVFLIDRAGRIPYRGDRPIPLADPMQTIDALASGSDDGL